MPDTTYESFLQAARSSVVTSDKFPWYTHEAIARRAVDQQSCVWHAANSITLEHLDELGYGTCPVCEGVTAPGQPVHSLCKIRQERGHEIERLDATPRCFCAKCQPSTHHTA